MFFLAVFAVGVPAVVSEQVLHVHVPAHQLVHVSRDDEYDGGTHHHRADNGRQFVAEQLQAAHQPNAGGHEKETEVAYQEVRHLLDLGELHHPQLQGGCEQQHADDARRYGDAGQPYHQFAHGEEGEQYAALQDNVHDVVVLKKIAHRGFP